MRIGALASTAAKPPAALADVVRRALGTERGVLQDWRVEQLSERGVRNPDGLRLFSGQMRDGQRPRSWSVVAKILHNEDAEGLPQDHLWYWKREVLAFESTLLSDLPPGIAAPRCYRIEPHDDDVWIWMEHIADAAPRVWASTEYVRAADSAGRFAGAYLTGRDLPDERWLVRDHARGWAGDADPDQAWTNTFVRRSFPAPLRRHLTRLWEQRERWFGWLQQLPQTFAHGDYHRRNLMIPPASGRVNGVTAIDWAFCGIAPVGGDLGMLLGMGAVLRDIDPAALRDLEPSVWDAYLGGLRDAGWTGDGALARLGYASWLVVYAAMTAPWLTAFWTDESRRAECERQFGPPAQAASHWAAVAEFALDRADEARALARRLLS
jgi:hypothetical protein